MNVARMLQPRRRQLPVVLPRATARRGELGNQAAQAEMRSGAVQHKLKIGDSADPAERAADRMADRIIDGVKAGTSNRTDVGETGIVRRTEAGARMPAASRRLSGLGGGRPLDRATRRFFEPRFGRDLSDVRVHTGAAAAAQAQGIGSRAFTFGSDIVFNTGEFAPATRDGRWLLAHELAHVVQQRASGLPEIQRQPQGAQPESGSRRRPPGPGESTPQQYETWAKEHPKREYTIGGPWEPDFLYARYTPEWFWDRGYVYAGYGGNYPYLWFEVWISNFDGGKEFRVWRRDTEAKQRASSKAQEAGNAELWRQALKEQPKDWKDWPDELNPNLDRENLFGPAVAERRNVDGSFGKGDVLLYQDGTAELFLEGTTQSYVLRPLPGGGCVVYGPEGRRLDGRWVLPPSDFPDPKTDAID